MHVPECLFEHDHERAAPWPMTSPTPCSAWSRCWSAGPRRACTTTQPASVRWDGGTRFVARHPNGPRCPPTCRASWAAAATRSRPAGCSAPGSPAAPPPASRCCAAREGVALRGARRAGREPIRHARHARPARQRRRTVPAAPHDLQLQVRIAADGIAPEHLRDLVERACRLLAGALRRAAAPPLDLRITGRLNARTRRWTRCRKRCGSCAWWARSSSTRASPRRGATTRRTPTQAAPFLEPGAERVVIFHLITEGECFVEMGHAPRPGWWRATS